MGTCGWGLPLLGVLWMKTQGIWMHAGCCPKGQEAPALPQTPPSRPPHEDFSLQPPLPSPRSAASPRRARTSPCPHRVPSTSPRAPAPLSPPPSPLQKVRPPETPPLCNSQLLLVSPAANYLPPCSPQSPSAAAWPSPSCPWRPRRASTRSSAPTPSPPCPAPTWPPARRRKGTRCPRPPPPPPPTER